MTLQHNRTVALHALLLLIILICLSTNYGAPRRKPKREKSSKFKMCLPKDETVRAKRKTCLLRPDNGPCRADILVWYYDAKDKACYRFFWGGCQGNGNNFRTRQECINFCVLTTDMETMHTPYFCSLPFDYGTCFGQYNRWSWDKHSGHCKRRMYSGCGGNQNNFETKHECMGTCLLKPNNTLNRHNHALTTCIPFTLPDMDMN